MNKEEIVKHLQKLANPEAIKGMARYGIVTDKALGISIPTLRQLAKQIGRNHITAEFLWETEYLEARMLASMVAEPDKTTEELLENWVKEFNSWDICDQVCSNLIEKTVYAYDKAYEWVNRDEEFVKRAGFVMMARLAVSDKKADDNIFITFFPYIIKGSTDERNFVKKAVNWALRQIGKRNINLNKEAIKIATDIKQIESKSARWIASDALRELTSQEVQARLIKKSNK